MLTAVGLGAFGAHGLEGKVSAKALSTWKTGVSYQIYHALALLGLAAIHSQYQSLKLSMTYNLFLLGTALFSFNCYLYAVTGIKVIAMIIPLGGISFMVGWLLAVKTFIKDFK
ncbi:MAG: hypothetical protein CME64_01885 [Halobacteriovoraceae bacterium]|nr:hypothetical protein [Halobacteriovoraceae bacterium]